MNNHIQEALFRQKIRRKFKKILKETKKPLVEQDLYTTFVEPFKDVLTSVNLAVQDIVSGLLVFYSMFWTFDPKKMQKKLDRFDKRYESIGAKWAPIMERTDASLSTGDADMVAWVFAPGLYGASITAEYGMKAGDTVNDFLTGTGLKASFLDSIPGVSFETVTTGKSEDTGKSLLDKMELLFLGAVAVGAAKKAAKKKANENTKRSKTLLREAPEGNLQDQFLEYFEQTGILDEVRKTQAELLEAYEESIKDFDDLYEERQAFLEEVTNASTFEEFKSALESAAQESSVNESFSLNEQEAKGLDTQSLKEMLDEIEKTADDLSKQEEFINGIKEETGKEEVAEEELKKAALNVVFAKVSSDMKEKMATGASEMKKQVSENIIEIIPPNDVLEKIKKTKEGIKLFNMIQDTKNKYDIK